MTDHNEYRIEVVFSSALYISLLITTNGKDQHKAYEWSWFIAPCKDHLCAINKNSVCYVSKQLMLLAAILLDLEYRCGYIHSEWVYKLWKKSTTKLLLKCSDETQQI